MTPDNSTNRSYQRRIAIGFSHWKSKNILPFLAVDPRQVVFVRNADEARALEPRDGEDLIFWGSVAPPGIQELSEKTGAHLVRMEDGFVRSVGLGSDYVKPLSLVLDRKGIYFDPRQESDLEFMLNGADFSDEELSRARAVRAFIVDKGVTKYNTEPRELADWASSGRQVVFVPGQVEDDASIRFGCAGINTNLGLLESARCAHPDAFIVYKPHPDVMASNRKMGRVALDAARRFADHIETSLSVVSCIEACDVVHTMTSLTGFDALLRGKHVVVYGRPFYAGWGLTEDRLQVSRRSRKLSLDQLVAGALLRYPVYFDWEKMEFTTCESVLERIVETRNALEKTGDLDRLRIGYIRRKARRWLVRIKSWCKL